MRAKYVVTPIVGRERRLKIPTALTVTIMMNGFKIGIAEASRFQERK
jgi:hypothetical protein